MTVVEETNDPVRVSTTPITPGTKNQLLSKPGLYKKVTCTWTGSMALAVLKYVIFG